ncbi:cupin domain-containing protein [Roseivirga misakiensis]|uniref:(S)-ureidoglycine aminohydrolase cupin domain-containing protein n=1 Tax=Roseivirga misakiensis TaxID=1563681 RepID=A0A1E5SKT0_9BACT|nr:cupin domain-containing protein [Roseivirga misakiensis]OEJ99730.1 hypothetical protein BFP71_09180 [Roseivirga misakiensis]
MNKLNIFFGAILFIGTIANETFAQTTLKPIPFDKSALSGIGLKKVELKDEPEREFYQKRLIRGKDLSVYIVSSQSWTTRMNDFSIDEVVYMLNGKANIKPDQGSSNTFQSNEFFFIPKGYTGAWQIDSSESLHYELSIITTDRSASKNEQLTVPQLYSKDDLSGINIKLNDSGSYEKTLTTGAELTIKLKAQKPIQKDLKDPAKEMIIHVLSGQLTIGDSSGGEQVFYTGDFFMIPAGFTGQWKSDGHGLVKYLTIEKTNT